MLEAAYEFYSVGNYKKADAIMKEIVKRVVRKRL